VAASAPIDLLLRVKGMNDLQKLQFRVTQLEKQLKLVDKTLPSVTSETSKFGKAAGRSAGLVGKLASAVGGLAIGAKLKEAFGDAVEQESSNKRIERLVKNYKQLSGIQAVAASAANKFIRSQKDVQNELTDLGNRLGSTGITLQEIKDVYEGFNTLLVNNRVSAQEAAGATLQLNQALGSGKLSGDEFRAVSEATPQLLEEVSRVLGVARGDLKELAREGKISSAVLIKALQNINRLGAADLEDAFTGSFGAIRKFNRATEELSTVVGQKLLPAVTPLIELLTQAVNLLAELPGPIQSLLVGLTALSVPLLLIAPALSSIIPLITGIGGKLLIMGGAAGTAAGALSLTTKALVLLKGAMIATGWGAIIVALGAIAYGASQWYDKQKQLNDLLNKSTDEIKDVQVETDKLTTAIKDKYMELDKAIELELRMAKDMGKTSIALQTQKDKVKRLREELEKLKGRYEVVVDLKLNRSVEGGTGIDNRPGQGAAVLDWNKINAFRETLKLEDKANLDAGSSSSGSSSSKSSGEEQLKQLKQRIALLRETDETEKQLLEIEQNRINLIDDFKSNVIEADQAALIAGANQEASLLKQELLAKQAGEAFANFEIKRQEAMEAKEEALRPLQQEIELLDAIIAGTGDEVALQIEARNIATDVKDLTEDQVLAVLRVRDARREEVAEMEKGKKLMADAYNIVANNLTSGIQGLINGTKEWGDILSNILGQLGSMFLNAGFNGLGKGLNLIPGKANGGPVSASTPYMVGERGPELFVPSTGGSIVPNEALSRYNGGNSDSGSSRTIRFQSEIINNVEYVTASQAMEMSRAAADDGAKRGAAAGHARSMSTLKNSRGQRQKLGMS